MVISLVLWYWIHTENIISVSSEIKMISLEWKRTWLNLGLAFIHAHPYRQRTMPGMKLVSESSRCSHPQTYGCLTCSPSCCYVPEMVQKRMTCTASWESEKFCNLLTSTTCVVLAVPTNPQPQSQTPSVGWCLFLLFSPINLLIHVPLGIDIVRGKIEFDFVRSMGKLNECIPMWSKEKGWIH